MNILLTGGMGYIGSHTAVALCAAGHRVVLYDNLCNSSAEVRTRIERITGQSPVFIEADVRDQARLARTLKAESIDAVIHFAGLKAVGESVEKPIEYYDNNVGGTLALLAAMRAADVSVLVFSSSATVYGPPQYLPLDEAHPTGATTNPYGRSKYFVEAVLRDAAVADPALKVACLRYFNPVGAHASGLLGERPNGIPNNLMPYVAQVASGEREFVRVFGDDYPTRDGTGVRDYIHVMDLAEGHLAALDFLADRPGWHAINLGTGRGYSVLEMIAAFSEAVGRELPYRILPRRAGDVAEVYADPRRAWELLHWRARRDLAEMCESAAKFQPLL